MKFDTNAKMVRTLTAAVSKGIDKLILTPRVDVAGCGYVWLGIRKGRIELDGKLLLNRQIGEYLLAYLQGTELPEITDFDSDREICCQSDWLEAIATKLEKLATTAEEEYTETEDYAFRRDCRRNRVAGLMMLNGQGAGLTTRPSVPINRL